MKRIAAPMVGGLFTSFGLGALGLSGGLSAVEGTSVSGVVFRT